MPFSFELHFDPDTNNAVTTIWGALADAGLCDSHRNGTAPHITLAIAQTCDLSETSPALERFARSVAPFPFVLEQIDHFPAGVLFYRPQRSAQLDHVHQTFHRQFNFPPATNSHLYFAENWQPHCTLAIILAPEQLPDAITIAQQLELPRQGEFRELHVIEWPQVLERFRCPLGISPSPSGRGQG